ncbi:hypothetical protein DLH72_00580 [Candidatus Gracilibacteria bacterium]|nr:MAG: hypothetical protein DLH72_00580 [Candidatus Gracilibacteria bacterium]
MNIFKGKDKNGKYIEVKLGFGDKLYKNEKDLGFRVTQNGNIVNDNGRIVQSDTDVPGFLKKIGIFR